MRDAVDTADVQAEARNVGSEAPTVKLSIRGRHGSAWGRPFDAPVFLIDIDTTAVRVHNARAARGDTTIVVDLDVKEKDGRSRIDIRHAEIVTPADTWRTVAPAVAAASEITNPWKPQRSRSTSLSSHPFCDAGRPSTELYADMTERAPAC